MKAHRLAPLALLALLTACPPSARENPAPQKRAPSGTPSNEDADADADADADKAKAGPQPRTKTKAVEADERGVHSSVGPAADAPPVREDGTIYAETDRLMGTRFSINVYLPDGKTAREAGEAIQDALDEVARIEGITSEWIEDSDISIVNAKAGQGPIPVAPELVDVVARSLEISKATKGAFDISFHSVGTLWSFDEGSTPPSDSAIAQALPLVGYQGIKVSLADKTVELDAKGKMIGLGAIAKGYGVDRAAALLRERGFSDHIVEGGGDTYVSGTKGGKPWMVGVQDPKEAGAVGAIPAKDEAIVTSGNYQRFFEHEGIKYAHILDPKTGKPVPFDESPRSVTVVAANATDADAYATAVSVMGSERGFAFLEATPGLDGVIITGDDEVLISGGLTDRYQAIGDSPAADAGKKATSGR